MQTQQPQNKPLGFPPRNFCFILMQVPLDYTTTTTTKEVAERWKTLQQDNEVCDHTRMQSCHHVKHVFDSFTENSWFFCVWNWYPTMTGGVFSSFSFASSTYRLRSQHSVSGNSDLSGLFIGGDFCYGYWLFLAKNTKPV